MTVGSIRTNSLSCKKGKKSTPTKKARMPIEVEPFKPKKVCVMLDTCYIETNALDECGACIFKGHFYDNATRKVGVVLPSDTFFKI